MGTSRCGPARRFGSSGIIVTEAASLVLKFHLDKQFATGKEPEISCTRRLKGRLVLEHRNTAVQKAARAQKPQVQSLRITA